MEHKLTVTLVKNGVTMQISQQANEYGYLRVVAAHNGRREYGQIPGNGNTVYPRIEFLFCPTAQWLHELADRRMWSLLDDNETCDEVNARPTDCCEFDLTSNEVALLNARRLMPDIPDKPRPEPETEPETLDITSGLGIGGAGSDDYNIHTERDTMSLDNVGCTWEHGTRYDERCSSCGRVGEVCNRCGCCKRCH